MIPYEEELIAWLNTLPLIYRLIIIGAIPALLTSIGAVPVILGSKITDKTIDFGLGFSGGIMLVASFTSLLLPAIESGFFIIVYLGFIIGALMIFVMDKTIPHLHVVKGYEGPKGYMRALKSSFLIALAIIIHNIPEGMTVGVSVISNTATGLIIGLAIGIQDIPEGLAVAFPVYRITKSVRKSLGISFLSGFSELLAGLIPFIIISLYPQAIGTILPFLMSFSAGAMIYVVVHELVPEIYSHGHDDLSTLGFFSGFLIMLLLDTLLG